MLMISYCNMFIF